MKLCFSTLGCADRDPEQIIRTAHTFGIPFLEIRGMGGVMDNREIPAFQPENRPLTKAKFADAHLQIQVIGTSACFHNPAERKGALAEAHATVELAAALDAPFIRVFGNNTGSAPAEAIRSVKEGLRILADDAAAHGVTVLLETHGDFRDESTLCPILDALGDHPGFGLIWDVMHTYFATGRNFLPLYRLLRPSIRHVHFKDCTPDRQQVLPGKGDIPLPEILRQLQQDSFDGCISLEWERKWHPDLPPIEDALTAMRELLAQI